MQFIRVVTTSNINPWIRQSPSTDTLVKIFKPPRVNAEEPSWSTSVYQADDWSTIVCCVAAKIFVEDVSSLEGAFAIALTEQDLSTTEIGFANTPTRKNGNAHTSFSEVDRLHYDLTGGTGAFKELSKTVYCQHTEEGNRIMPVPVGALYSGLRALRTHANVPKAKELARLETLLADLDQKWNTDFPVPEIDPHFGDGG